MRRADVRAARARVVHGLNDDGAVRCNPRDAEARHRAEIGDLRIGDAAAITCPRCRGAGPRAARSRTARIVST